MTAYHKIAEKFWTHVRSMLPGGGEPFLVHQFLDSVVTRIKHPERIAAIL